MVMGECFKWFKETSQKPINQVSNSKSSKTSLIAELILTSQVRKKIRKIYQTCLHIGSLIAIQRCVHCEGKNLTEFQPSTSLNCPQPCSWVMNCFAVMCSLEGQDPTEVQPSNCLNHKLRSSNRVQPSRLGLNLPQFRLLHSWQFWRVCF